VPLPADELLARWSSTLEPLLPGGRAPAAAAAGEDLLARWAEPHRRYHDQRHLREVLAALDVLGPAPVEAVLAAFWHDAVYDPAAPDNEERSAVLAGAVLTDLAAPPGLTAEVARLVRSTADHVVAGDDAAAVLLCDADLWVLAAPPARYAEYARAVREEYAHVPDEAFTDGRSAVLHALVDRPRLYTCDLAHRQWEQSARDNVRAELQRLSQGRVDGRAT